MMRSSRGQGRQSGFTLIELLVVMAIVAILVAILLPTLTKVRETTRRIVCASNLHQQGIGIMAYASDNRLRMFTHQRSIQNPTCAYYVEGDSNYITLEQREAGPSSSSSNDAAGCWQWDQMGGSIGSGGFFPGLFPSYIQSGNVFDCPSVFYYGWANMGYYAGWEPVLHFEDHYGKYLRGQTASGTYFNSYLGNVYGRADRNFREYGHGFWSSYYVQGYYPYSEDYKSSYGALLWDIGSRGFWLGATGTVTNGNHKVGANELFIDLSVKWRHYPWYGDLMMP